MSAAKRQGEERRESKRRRQQSTSPADWDTVDATVLRHAIATVGRAGGAIRFGYTRDGGAYAVGILGDGDPYTEYLRPSEDVAAYLEGLIEDWTE